MALSAIPAFLVAWQAIEENKVLHAERVAVYGRLTGATMQYLDFLVCAVFASTDDSLPKTKEELFSRSTANLLCDDLDISHPPAFFKGPTWRDQFIKDSRVYRAYLTEILNNHAHLLSAEQVKLVSLLQPSTLLMAGENSFVYERSGTPARRFAHGGGGTVGRLGRPHRS